MGHSKAKLCFSQPELAALCEEIRTELPDLHNIYTKLPRLNILEQHSVALPDVTLIGFAAIMYTSRTTARPKGVIHIHVSLVAGAEMMSSLGVDQTDSLLAPTQLMHIAALSCVLLPGIFCSKTVVLLPAFDAAQCLDLIERWRCSYLLILPEMLQFVVEEQGRIPRAT